MLGASFLAMGAAARGDTRANSMVSAQTHNIAAPWCLPDFCATPARNITGDSRQEVTARDWSVGSDYWTATLNVGGGLLSRAGRTPGTNLSACSYSRSDKHPSVSSVPRDEMKRGAGVSPAALTISKFEACCHNFPPGVCRRGFPNPE